MHRVSAASAPTTQISRNMAVPEVPARKPLAVKIPVPIMFDTTRAVALTTPNWRTSVTLAWEGCTG